MKLYHSGQRGVAYNTVYRNEVDVQNVEQLLKVTAFDHVAARYQDGHRSADNFIESDCLMLDIDNAPGKGQPDIPPSEWVDLDRIRADLPDVCFYAVPSKSHMKEKDGRPARPKYHLYFPIPLTTDAQEYKRIKEEVAARLPYFDPNAVDAGRFFFGHAAQQAWLYEGSKVITDWIKETPRPEQPEGPKPERQQRTTQPQQQQEKKQKRERESTANPYVEGNRNRIVSALNAIPCEKCNFKEWSRVGIALNSLRYPDSLQLWDDWSKTDTARYIPGDCAIRWRRFVPDGSLDHTYIIHLAKQYGWTPPQTEQPEGETMQEEKKPDTEQEETAAEQATQLSQVALMLQDFRTRKYEPLPTGINEIDNAIGGGFFIQTLVTLGAAPGAGKTMLAQQMFEGMAREGKADVVFVNLEMSTQQLMARSLSRMTGYKPLDIMQGYAWTPEQEKKIVAAAEEYEQTIGKHFYYMPLDTADYQTIIDRVTEYESKRQNRDIPFAMVVDYVQLLQSTKERLDDVETIKRALKALKDFCTSKDRKALVFLITAHSRALNESGIVAQGAGRDSSSFEYSADLQLSLNYLEIVNGNCRNKADMAQKILSGSLTKTSWSKFALSVTKSRFGPSGNYVPMQREGKQSRFIMIKDTRNTTEQKDTKIKALR